MNHKSQFVAFLLVLVASLHAASAQEDTKKLQDDISFVQIESGDIISSTAIPWELLMDLSKAEEGERLTISQEIAKQADGSGIYLKLDVPSALAEDDTGALFESPVLKNLLQSVGETFDITVLYCQRVCGCLFRGPDGECAVPKCCP